MATVESEKPISALPLKVYLKSHWAISVMYSFLTLSILVTRSENLNIFHSATSSLLVSATISKPYIRGSHTAILYHIKGSAYIIS